MRPYGAIFLLFSVASQSKKVENAANHDLSLFSDSYLTSNPNFLQTSFPVNKPADSGDDWVPEGYDKPLQVSSPPSDAKPEDDNKNALRGSQIDSIGVTESNEESFNFKSAMSIRYAPYLREIGFSICGMAIIMSFFWFSHIKTASRSILLCTFAMNVVCFIGLNGYQHLVRDYTSIWLPALGASQIVGLLIAIYVPMFRIPETVAASHALVGISACFIAFSTYITLPVHSTLDDNIKSSSPNFDQLSFVDIKMIQIESLITAITGAMTFSGSVIAAIGLSGLISVFEGTARILGGRRNHGRWIIPVCCGVVALLCIPSFFRLPILAIPADQFVLLKYPKLAYNILALKINIQTSFYLISASASVFGLCIVSFASPGDMAYFISILNALAGASAALTGVMLKSPLLAMVGCAILGSGSVTASHTAHASGKSIWTATFGAFKSRRPLLPPNALLDSGAGSSNGESPQEGTTAASRDLIVEALNGERVIGGSVLSAFDLASRLSQSKKIVIVPGYGCCVSHAQFECARLAEILSKPPFRADVVFGLHPVAGRMPGQLNILLSEAGVPSEIQLGIDAVNAQYFSDDNELAKADLCLVVGASDTVNPSALENPHSSLFGMQIIKAFNAKRVFVLKRTPPQVTSSTKGQHQGRGFADEDNPLLSRWNCHIVPGDASKTLQDVLSQVTYLARVNFGSGEVSDNPRDFSPAPIASPPTNLPESWRLPTASPSIPVPAVPAPFAHLPYSLKAAAAANPSSVAWLRPTSQRRPNLISIANPDTSILANFPALCGCEIILDPSFGPEVTTANRNCKVGATRRDLLSSCLIIYLPDVVSQSFIDEFVEASPILLQPFDRETHRILITNLGGATAECRRQLMALTNLSIVALDRVPRLTRSQAFDMRTSVGTILGYQSAVACLTSLPCLPGRLIAPAGDIQASRVLVIGAGVAGLMAARLLAAAGCQVLVVDNTEKTFEEVSSINGAHFFLRTEGNEHQFLIALANANAVVCTVQPSIVSGNPIQILTDNHVRAMSSSAQLIDLPNNASRTAAETKKLSSPLFSFVRRPLTRTSLSTTSEVLLSLNIMHMLAYLSGGVGFSDWAIGGSVLGAIVSQMESRFAGDVRVIEDSVLHDVLVFVGGFWRFEVDKLAVYDDLRGNLADHERGNGGIITARSSVLTRSSQVEQHALTDTGSEFAARTIVEETPPVSEIKNKNDSDQTAREVHSTEKSLTIKNEDEVQNGVEEEQNVISAKSSTIGNQEPPVSSSRPASSLNDVVPSSPMAAPFLKKNSTNSAQEEGDATSQYSYYSYYSEEFDEDEESEESNPLISEGKNADTNASKYDIMSSFKLLLDPWIIISIIVFTIVILSPLWTESAKNIILSRRKGSFMSPTILLGILSCLTAAAASQHVPTSLHSPLMTLTNALSGIVVVAAFAFKLPVEPNLTILSANAVRNIIVASAVLSSINISAGLTLAVRCLSPLMKVASKS